MAGVIDRVTTANAYGTTPATGALQNLWTGRGGSYTVGNAAVFYQLQYGTLGSDVWTPEAYAGPSVGVIEPGTTGIRFRSYTAGTPAVVFATIAEGKEPLLSGQQFGGTIAASGQVIPPTVSDFQLIQKQPLTITAANFLFSAIPTTFSSLILSLYARADNVAVNDPLVCQFNGDGAANYDWQETFSGNAAVGQEVAAAATQIKLGAIPAASAPANVFGQVDAVFDFYQGAANQKTVRSMCSLKQGLTVADLFVFDTAGFWRSNAAISSINIFPTGGSFVAGSYAALYGRT